MGGGGGKIVKGYSGTMNYVSCELESTQNCHCYNLTMGRVAQSVQRMTTGWTVRGSNLGGARFSARPGRQPPVQRVPGLSRG